MISIPSVKERSAQLETVPNVRQEKGTSSAKETKGNKAWKSNESSGQTRKDPHSFGACSESRKREAMNESRSITLRARFRLWLQLVVGKSLLPL